MTDLIDNLPPLCTPMTCRVRYDYIVAGNTYRGVRRFCVLEDALFWAAAVQEHATTVTGLFVEQLDGDDWDVVEFRVKYT